MEKNGTLPEVSLRELFFVMFKIGAFTIGGGYAMLLAIGKELIGRGWVSEDEFQDYVALSQSSVGLLAVNISIFTGYHIRGFKGAVIATLGSCMPPFLIILLIAIFFHSFKDNPIVLSAFAGMRPVVVALIAVPMIKMARNTCKKWWQWILAAGVLALVAFGKVSAVVVIIVMVVLSVSVPLAKTLKRRSGE